MRLEREIVKSCFMVPVSRLEERKKAARRRLIRTGLWSNLSSLSQVIDKFHRGVRYGVVFHDVPDILLDISARGDLDHPVRIQGRSAVSC